MNVTKRAFAVIWIVTTPSDLSPVNAELAIKKMAIVALMLMNVRSAKILVAPMRTAPTTSEATTAFVTKASREMASIVSMSMSVICRLR